MLAPELLFNLGQAYRLGGKPDRALTAYKSYLREAAPDAPNLDQVKRHVTDLEVKLSLSHAIPIPRAGPPPLPVVKRDPFVPEPPRRPAGLGTPTLVTAGATVLLAAGAIFSGVSANSRHDAARNGCARTGGCTEAQIDGIKSRAHAANVLWVLTAVGAVATGATFYFTGREAGVGLAGRF